jgi:hypothetical protein
MNAPAKDFNKIRAAFMRKVSAPTIPALALKLAYVLAFKYMNVEEQAAHPAQETLAADLNVEAVRTVQRLLDVLQPLGLVVVPGHGPGRSSTYWIDPDKATRVSPINTTSVSPTPGKRRHLKTEKATPESPQLN